MVVRACQLLGWKRLSCFGHNLDLAIHKALDDRRVERVLRVCQQVVAKFSQSWKKTRELTLVQEEKKLPKHKLKADCPTRWGSAFDMISRIVEQQEAIRVVLANDRKTAHLIPTWQDFDVLDSMLAVLTPLREMTDTLSGEKSVSISAVKPLLRHICDTVLLRKEGDSTLTTEMKQKIRNDLTSRYSDPDTDHLLTVSTFLDPRFKHVSLPGNEIDCEMFKDTVKMELEELLTEQGIGVDTIEENTQPDQPTGPIPLIPPLTKKRKVSSLSKILGQSQATSTSTSQSPSDKMKHEIECYTRLPVLEVDSNALDWWKREADQLTYLSMLARKYLCVCATSVAAERVFSTGGKVVTVSRSSLKPEKVDQLVFFI